MIEYAIVCVPDPVEDQNNRFMLSPTVKDKEMVQTQISQLLTNELLGPRQ